MLLTIQSSLPISIYLESNGVPMALQSTSTCWEQQEKDHYQEEDKKIDASPKFSEMYAY